MATIELNPPRGSKLMSPSRRALQEAEEEGYISLGRSAARHWATVGVASVIGLALGVGAGAAVAPTYTSVAKLIVGKSLNLTNTAAISGFPSAEAQLAEDFARLAGTPSFDADVRSKLGHGVQGSVIASQVAASPVIEVYGYSHTQTGATAMANAGSAALIDAINTVNQQTGSANQSLLSQYQAEALVVEQAREYVASLQSQLTYSSGAARTALMQQIAQAQAAVTTEQFKLNTLGNQYQASFNPNLAIQSAVSPLGGAAPQGGNRTTHIEIGGIAGLVSGIVVGLGVAAMVDIRADRRMRRLFNIA